ncbi:MAG TPA: hypothetical protein VL974_03765 [Magnetospirillum sp.]|nr:hypothetical protein [Magnetospirillum sp.]
MPSLAIMGAVLVAAFLASLHGAMVGVDALMRDLRSIGAVDDLEGAMLLCFLLAWPVKLARLLRTRRAEGVSPSFLALILTGYACGFSAKMIAYWGGITLPTWLLSLYGGNAAMAAAVLVLTLRFRAGSTAPASFAGGGGLAG